MDFLILGPFQVLQDGRPVDVGGQKHRTLLAILVLHPNQVVSVDRLIDAVWDGRPPATAPNAIQVYVSQLRRALGKDRLQTKAPGYLLRIDEGELDLGRFQQLAQEGRYRSALSIWRGPPLAEFADMGFARGEIARLAELRLACVEERVEADLAEGRHVELVGELEALVRDHPLRERLRAQLMLALYRSKRQAEALEAYRAARSAMVEELGIEPGRELRELEAAILRQDPALDAVEHASGRKATVESEPHERSIAAHAGRHRRRLFVAGVLLLAGGLTALTLALTRSRQGEVAVFSNSVVAIDPETNRVVDDIRVGNSPSSVALGAGAVWVLNGDDRTVSRIELSGNSVRTLSTGGTPTDLSVDSGTLWVVDGFAGTVYEVDARSSVVEHTFHLLPLRLAADSHRSRKASVAAAGGAVWVSIWSSENEIFAPLVWRIDPVRNRVVTTFHQGGGDIATGRDAVWVSGPTVVLRIDPRSNTVTRVDAPIEYVRNIAAGTEAAWITSAGHGTLTKVGSFSEAIERTITIGGSPAGVAVGHGSVWVANTADGTVSRVDPLTARIRKTIRLGGSPVGVAVGDKNVWVTVD